MAFFGRFLIIFALFCAHFDAKTPISHETMWLMKRVGSPVPSPDGKWVVFSVTEPSYDPAKQISDLWIVPADGSAKPRRLTFTKGGESGVAWSPDSRRIAFSAKREGDGVAQVYVLDLGGGEAIRITSLETGAESPRWSPDSKSILFTSLVYPADGEDRKNRKYNALVYNDFPIRNWDRWLDERHVHPFVQAAEPGATARDLLAGTKLISEPGFGGELGNSGEELDAVWMPDGRSIVLAATLNRNAAAYDEVVFHLFRTRVDGGEPEKLTGGEGSYGKPTFSPDGKALYAVFNPSTAKIYNLNRIARFAWPEMGRPAVITASFDRSADSFAVSPDGRTVFVLAEEHGHDKIFAVPAAVGEAKQVLDVKLGCYSGLTAPEKAEKTILFAAWQSAVNPPEIVRIDPSEARHTLLSDFAVEAAAAVDWQPARHFWFTSKRGKQIHNMIVLPPAFDESKKYPLLVFMHGGPHNMSKDQFILRWNYHLLAQPGYVVLTTNYTGSTGFGEKFAQEIQGDPLKGPGDEINEAADEAIRRFPFIDGTRQAAAGASYGGHLANWLQATTTRYKCLVSHAGLINLESQWGTSDTIYHRERGSGGPVWEQGPVWREQNPIRFAANFRTPILLTVGEKDFRVPINQTIENWSVLKRLKIPSRLIVFPDENHWIQKGENSRFFWKKLHEWLKQYVGN
jgi:dipeptidyl aminopeptidase/acylaminoacyl peptidase